jgi:hypothetical protein
MFFSSLPLRIPVYNTCGLRETARSVTRRPTDLCYGVYCPRPGGGKRPGPSLPKE